VLRFALAHHPTCSLFARDVIAVHGFGRKAPLCAGCVAFWPALLLGFPLLVGFASLPWWVLFAGGATLALVQLASYAGLSASRGAKLAVKALVGLAGASMVAGLVQAPWPLVARILAILALIIVAGAMQTLRLRKIVATCDECPWKRDWQHCPGFAPLNDHRPGEMPVGYESNAAGLPEAWPWR
jgi:hypothetical protein